MEPSSGTISRRGARAGSTQCAPRKRDEERSLQVQLCAVNPIWARVGMVAFAQTPGPSQGDQCRPAFRPKGRFPYCQRSAMGHPRLPVGHPSPVCPRAARRKRCAVTQHGRREVVDADLRDYFNSIPHAPLMRAEVVSRPGQIGDFCDEPRLDPVHARKNERRAKAG
jgi:hypothetical protein